MGQTILIVDDESHITTLLAHKFRQAGHEVLTADDGEQAFRLACQHRPDLVITDFQMPMLSGLDLSVRLRADSRTRQVPVIILTARSHKMDGDALARTNIRHVMSKPFSAKVLLDRAQAVLDERGAAAALPAPPNGAQGTAA